MTLKLYNSLTRKKEEFIPAREGKVGIYACGPTTYNYFHLGNARMLVAFDMIRRYLLYKGYDVTYVQNFTDVDDKIINKAAQENCDPLKLAQRYIVEYFKDAHALNIMDATIHPKATEHIEDMIKLIKGLEEKELAYEVDGDVYFAVNNFKGYGKLSGRSLEDMQAGARVDINEKKRNPMDFALWKKAKEGEPAWKSPWGQGRPGWHIECSAMSLKYLGAGFDIHGGGGDLVFPHHENEIAQSEGYLGGNQQFCKYWMHNAFITINHEKMSKSLGNFFMVRDVLKKFGGEIIRFYLLGTHYRSPLDFDDEKLEAAAKGFDRLKTSIRLAAETVKKAPKNDAEMSDTDVLAKAGVEAVRAFEEAMDDDFNSAQAYAALFELAREMNSYVAGSEISVVALKKASKTLIELAGVLGLELENAEDASLETDKLGDVMELLLEVRVKARENKDWKTSDLIRDRLKEIGITIEDLADGARWYFKQ
ncbi:MAG: cysteine--tRNA ligase [Eubacteriales bacterium]